jgi:hypothetical protein
MSKITGSEVASLMEAYSSVYAPQELTEEQIWEEVENWVNSLLEEGYDLSEYTWEEMYEEYLSEMGQRMTTGQITAPKAAPAPTSRPQVAGGGMGGMRGSGRNRNAYQTSSSPGALRVKPTSPSPAPAARTPSPAPAARTPSPAPAARTPSPSPAARTPSPSPAPAARTPSPAPAARTPSPAPAARTPSPAPAARPSGGTPSSLSKPTETATPSAPRQKDTSITDMIGRSQVRQGAPINTGSKSSDIRAMAAKASIGAAPTPKPAPPVTPKQTPRQARLNMEMEYDTFDTILEHLVAEGYADTNEAALVIMANMSEDWRQSILDEEAPKRIAIEPTSPRLMKDAGPARVHNPQKPKKVK